jgi:glycosyltransferase involved in cell wall biosynthesis
MLESIQTAIKQLHAPEWTVLCAFCAIYIFRISYHIFFTGRVFYKKPKFDAGGQALSLILTVRNEENNIQNYLPSLLEIKNAGFELIAVDDFSSDNSTGLLGTLKEKYGNLKISALNQETWYSVKMAQNIAIKASGYDWIMVIPPSVCKFNPEWLQTISASLKNPYDVIVNYSNVRHTGSFFNALYRIESFLQQMGSAGFTVRGLPFIISEENVAFRKDKYYSTGGYRHKVGEPYANLELLINTFIRKKNTNVLFNEKTTIFKDETIGASDFFDLLKKEIRIRKYLNISKKIMPAFEEFTQCLFLPLIAVIYILIPPLLPVLSFLLFLIILIRLFIIKKAVKRLNERKLLLSSLIYAMFVPYLKLVYRFYYNHYILKKRCKNKR